MAGTIANYIAYGTIAARPASPAITAVTGGSARYFATDTLIEYAWDGSAWQVVNAMNHAVAEQIVTGSVAATLTFSSIPSAFRHLRLVVVGGSDQSGGADYSIRFNGDTGANYDAQRMQVNSNALSSAPATVAQTSLAHGSLAPFSISPAAAGNTHDILDYARTTWHKVVQTRISLKVGTGTTNFYTVTADGYWRSTAAITSITLTPTAGNFAIGTVATLWGVL